MSSSIPAAIQNLITLARQTLPDDAMVWFGKALPTYTAPLTLQILGVTGDQEPIVLAADQFRMEETYAIQCELTSFAGGTPESAYTERLTEVTDNFALLTIALGNDPTLNGAVRWARIAAFEYTPDADPKGLTLGRMAFEVHCEQRISVTN